MSVNLSRKISKVYTTPRTPRQRPDFLSLLLLSVIIFGAFALSQAANHEEHERLLQGEGPK